MTPPFGMYAALSAQMAGSLRHSHSRLVEFAEEVAFMKGEEIEKMLIEREYAAIIEHENRVLQKRWWHGCVEEGIIKWLWGSFGVSVTLPTSHGDLHINDFSLFFVPFPPSSKYPVQNTSI